MCEPITTTREVDGRRLTEFVMILYSCMRVHFSIVRLLKFEIIRIEIGKLLCNFVIVERLSANAFLVVKRFLKLFTDVQLLYFKDIKLYITYLYIRFLES